MSRKSAGGWTETVKTVLYAVLIAVVVRTVAFEPFNIPSASMVPTLLIGDYLFVSKYSYGYSRYSLPFGLPLIPGRVFSALPERGDVAVFKLPKDNKTDYIKRIVGLPGDRIQVKGGILYINDQPVARERIADLVESDGFGNERRRFQYIETLPNGRKHRIIEISDREPNSDDTTVYQVPKDHLFAMGDNRDNSLDSRYIAQVGYVPIENLVGRAEMIFFSTDGGAAWWEFWRWPFSIRFGRLFQGIQ
ncbi:MAG: signal peptidase I [Alphaproteobacteria bacterium]|nr:signal peptidase I [Alphaproteobacteria bacterium]